MTSNGIGGHQSPIEHSLEDSKPTPPSSATSIKRRDETNTSQPRAKRNRYIAIACNECKRRKIKCNGETPCQRCGNLSLDCVYAPNCCSSAFKDSDEYRQMNQQLTTLQDQVNALYASINDLHIKQSSASVAAPETNGHASAITPLDPQFSFNHNGSPTRPVEQQPPTRQFSAPANAPYYIDQAANGMRNPEEVAVGLSKPVLHASTAVDGNSHPAVGKDPLWSLTQDDALRLCQVYGEEIGEMYTLCDVEKATNIARTMFTFLDSIRRVGLMKEESERGDSFYDDDALLLKMILAIGAVCEGRGHSDLGESLFENVRRIMHGDDRMGKPATLKSVQLMALIAAYYARQDDEVRAYRFIGIAGRQAFEIGMQRQDNLRALVSTAEDLREAVRTFWAIYVLDLRFSFFTGMPNAMRENDIEPNYPDPDEGAAFLKSKVYYCKIAAKVSGSISGLDNRGLHAKSGEMSWLDWQIVQWQNAIPPDLRYNHLDITLAPEDLCGLKRQQRMVLYLMANELRVQLYRPVVFTVTSILESRGYVQTLIEIAKDSVHTLSELDKTARIFRIHLGTYHWFLVSAMAVLFLAVAHAPLEFSRQVREDFYLGLELIKTMNPKSYITKRLWKTIKNLKKVAPKLGLLPPSSIANANDPHSSAAVAMAGLAGHAVDGPATPWGPGVSPNMNDDPSPANGQQLSYELVSLFEVASGFGDAMLGKHAEFMMNGMEDGTTADLAGGPGSFSAMWTDDEFINIMKECF